MVRPRPAGHARLHLLAVHWGGLDPLVVAVVAFLSLPHLDRGRPVGRRLPLGKGCRLGQYFRQLRAIDADRRLNAAIGFGPQQSGENLHGAPREAQFAQNRHLVAEHLEVGRFRNELVIGLIRLVGVLGQNERQGGLEDQLGDHFILDRPLAIEGGVDRSFVHGGRFLPPELFDLANPTFYRSVCTHCTIS